VHLHVQVVSFGVRFPNARPRSTNTIKSDVTSGHTSLLNFGPGAADIQTVVPATFCECGVYDVGARRKLTATSYTGRADRMRSHWNTYHLDQGDYPTPYYDSYNSALSKAKQLGRDMLCPSEGLSAPNTFWSPSSSSVHSSDTASTTRSDISSVSEASVYFDEALMQALQSFTPLWTDVAWNMPCESTLFSFP